MRTLNLGGTEVGDHTGPYIIAEIGVNHGGDLRLAEELIRQAAGAGAHGVKFQSYKAGTLASKHSPAYWDTTKEPTLSQFKLFSKYDSFGEAEYVHLSKVATDAGADFLSTPFDTESAEYLRPIMPFYKIASADLTNVPLLRQVASFGKPVILSTGASTLGEIDSALAELRNAGCTDIALLHCILNYPTEYKNAHLRMIEGLRRTYPDLVIGYSDHTPPEPDMTTLLLSYALGARVIEKHFTHDKSLPGNDHYHAMDADDLKVFVAKLEHATAVLGNESVKRPLASETPARNHARRSIVIEGDLKAGNELGPHNLTVKRPAHGVSPIHWDEVIGRKISVDLEDDHVLQWEDIASEARRNA